MRKTPFSPLAAFLRGLVFLGNTNKTAPLETKGNDSSLTAISGVAADLPLDKIKLPAGFVISVYAEVSGTHSMAMSSTGTLFVGTQRAGNAYEVKDTNSDQVRNSFSNKASEVTVGEVSRVRVSNKKVVPSVAQ